MLIGLVGTVNNNLYKSKKTENISNLQIVSMFSSDFKDSLDELFHALSPRYLLRNMPGFIFSCSRRIYEKSNCFY